MPPTAVSTRTSHSLTDRRPGGGIYLVAVVLAALWITPILFLLSTSLRSQGDLISRGVFALPSGIRWSNFSKAWQTANMGRLFGSSLFLTLIKVPLGLMISSMAAYALAKTRLRFARPLMTMFLLGLGIPIYITLIPVVMLVRQLGLTDSPWGLLPPYIALGLPFQILVLTGFFRAVPSQLLEAARIDGCSEFGAFWKILIPLAKPALATLFIVDCVNTWNEFLLALVLLTSEKWRTVPLGMLHFQGQFSVKYAELAAAVTISIAPVILIYVLFQRYMVSGLTSGALKE